MRGGISCFCRALPGRAEAPTRGAKILFPCGLVLFPCDLRWRADFVDVEAERLALVRVLARLLLQILQLVFRSDLRSS
jgi:hypothetical protein